MFHLPGAYFENIEAGGANSRTYQAELRGVNLLFFLYNLYGRTGGARRVRPRLYPRLHITTNWLFLIIIFFFIKQNSISDMI